MIIAYLCVGMFLSLICYMVYFHVKLKDDVISSPYNRRQDTYAEHVVRGEIRASGGEVLAKTETDGEGNEQRVYPYGRVFAHAVGYDSNGRGGIELSKNSQLLTSHAFLLEQVQNGLTDQKNQGDNVITTLDANLQQVAYDALGNNQGAVVVLEADTGKVLALVSKPDFDPNTLAADWDAMVADENNSSLVNRATQGLYPPGSTFKIITGLAYLRDKGTLEGFSYNCAGEITQDGYTLHCYDGEVHGQEDFTKAFAKSCNTAFAEIGMQTSLSVFQKTAKDLLFNTDLSLGDMLSNSSSFTLDKDAGRPLTMQTSIGQGNTLVTPMHMAMITSAIANGGTAMKPYLVDEIQSYEGNRVKKYTPKTYATLMTEQEAQTLSALMQEVTASGTARSLSGTGYTVAGKTGSAEHAGSDIPHSWFVGFSNVEDPDIVVSIISEGSGTGSQVAVPIAKKIFDAYYNS